MYLNIDTEENLMKCAEAGEHDPTTGHIFEECPTYSEPEDLDKCATGCVCTPEEKAVMGE